MKILIIDDSKSARLVLTNILKRICADCEIVQSENGKDAFKLLQTNSFNHIFTDLDMGEDSASSGMTFIYKLLGNKILSKKKITIISASPLDQVKKAFLSHPNVSFVEKTSPDIMEKAIRELL